MEGSPKRQGACSCLVCRAGRLPVGKRLVAAHLLKYNIVIKMANPSQDQHGERGRVSPTRGGYFSGRDAGVDRGTLMAQLAAWETTRFAAAGLPPEQWQIYDGLGPNAMAIDGMIRYWQKLAQPPRPAA